MFQGLCLFGPARIRQPISAKSPIRLGLTFEFIIPVNSRYTGLQAGGARVVRNPWQRSTSNESFFTFLGGHTEQHELNRSVSTSNYLPVMWRIANALGCIRYSEREVFFTALHLLGVCDP